MAPEHGRGQDDGDARDGTDRERGDAACDDRERLRDAVDCQARRIAKAGRERRSMLAQTVYLGTVGMLLVVPIVGGAYLGRWLDELASGYSSRWTVSLIVLGVAVGGFNVYRFLRD